MTTELKEPAKKGYKPPEIVKKDVPADVLIRYNAYCHHMVLDEYAKKLLWGELELICMNGTGLFRLAIDLAFKKDEKRHPYFGSD